MGIIVLITFLFFCIFVGLTVFGISLLFSEPTLLTIVGALLSILPGLFFAFHTGMGLLGLFRPKLAKKIAISLDKRVSYGEQVKSKLEKTIKPSHELNTQESSHLSELREYRIQAEPPYREILRESDEESMPAKELRYNGEVLASFAEQISSVRETLYWQGSIEGNGPVPIELPKGHTGGVYHLSASARDIIVFTYSKASHFTPKIHLLNPEKNQIKKIEPVDSKELFVPMDGLPYTIFGVTEDSYIITFGTKRLSSYTSRAVSGYTHFYQVSRKDLKLTALMTISLKIGEVTGLGCAGGNLLFRTEDYFSRGDLLPEYWSLSLTNLDR